MQNPLGTCVILAILAGGFAFTGDLAWLVRRGAKVIEATDVPRAEPLGPAATTTTSRPTVAAPPRPAGGTDRVAIAAALPGQRIVAWLDGAAEPLTMDVVDPSSSAVILHGGTPRRVVIAGGTIVRGRPLRVMGIGLASGGATAAAESLGRVTALATPPAAGR